MKINTTAKLSFLKIILRGYLVINIPIVIIMISSWLVLVCYTNFNFTLCVIYAIILGWIYWEITIPIWIRWALKKNIADDRLLRIGKASLLLWNDRQIKKVRKKIGNENKKPE